MGKGKNKGKGSGQGSSSGAKKIVLKDIIPSAISVRVECHKILWAMVEVTSTGSETAATEVGDEMAESGVPLSFGKQHKKKEVEAPESTSMVVEASAPTPCSKKRKKSHFGINDNTGSRDLGMHGDRDARLSSISS